MTTMKTLQRRDPHRACRVGKSAEETDKTREEEGEVQQSLAQKTLP